MQGRGQLADDGAGARAGRTPVRRLCHNTRLLARKNWQVKKGQYRALSCGCLPCTITWELLLPVGIIVLFSYLKGLNATTAILGGWETVTEELFVEAVREQVPMHQMAVRTGAGNFMRTMLLPLHLRPRYKLALAAERPEDLPAVEEFRRWSTANWYPRQQLPVVPCLRSQRGAGRRRQLHSNGIRGTPLNMNVADLAQHYNDGRVDEGVASWVPGCQIDRSSQTGPGILSIEYLGCFNDNSNSVRSQDCQSLPICGQHPLLIAPLLITNPTRWEWGRQQSDHWCRDWLGPCDAAHGPRRHCVPTGCCDAMCGNLRRLHVHWLAVHR